MAAPRCVGDWIADRFEVHAVHEGGMGIVYVTYDHEGGPGRRVLALKRLRDEYLRQPGPSSRFYEECRAWIALERHPNIARAYSVLELEGHPHVLIELVTGGDLRRWIGTPRLDLPQALRFGIQLCLGMEHAARKGLRCHRDLKPANLLVTEGGTLKITDFGLAKVRDEPPEADNRFEPIPLEDAPEGVSIVPDEPVGMAGRDAPPVGPAAGDAPDADPMATADWSPAPAPAPAPVDPDETRVHDPVGPTGGVGSWAAAPASGLTQAGAMLGTAPYMGPEQFGDARSVDVRADLYSAGVVLFEMLTGFRPFRGATVTELEAQHRRDPPPRLAMFIPRRHRRVADRLDRIVQRCLEKDPSRRFDSFAELRAALAVCLRMATGERLSVPSEAELMAWERTSWGVALGTLGRHAEALGAYDAAIRIKRDYAPAWFNRAASLGSLGQFAEAVEAADSALELNPASVPALINKGLALQGLGRPDESRGCLHAAASLRPLDPEVWLGFWSVLREQGDRDGADRALGRALALGSVGPHAPHWVRRTEDTPAPGAAP